jgi:hypothetical protein
MPDKKMQSREAEERHGHSAHDVEIDLSTLPTELTFLPLSGGFIFPSAAQYSACVARTCHGPHLSGVVG